jgi:hypothetical protein
VGKPLIREICSQISPGKVGKLEEINCNKIVYPTANALKRKNFFIFIFLNKNLAKQISHKK